MLQETPDQSACLAEPDLRVLLGLLERRELRERKVLKDRPVGMGSRAQWVCQVPRDPKAHLERMVIRERLENLVRREAKPTRENRVLLAQLVYRDLLEHLDLLGATESPVRGASRACSDRREMKVPEVSLEPLVPLVCRVFLVPQGRRGKMATLVRWALLVRQVQEVPRVLVELMAPKVLPGVLVPWEVWGRRGKTVRLETLDPLENLALEGLKEREVTRERRGHLELQGPRGPKGPLEMTDPRETLDQLVSQEILVLPVSPVLRVLTEAREKREKMANLVKLVPLVHLERQAHLDHLAREDLQEPRVQRAGKERRAPRVRLELRDHQVKRAPSGPRAPQGSQAQKVYEESLALSVNKDFLALPDKMALLDPWVPPACRV